MMLAAALKRKKLLEMELCINPADPDSRASEKQLPILKDSTHSHVYVVSGNQSGKCLISQTKIATPHGPVNIEDLEPGDTVYNEFGKEIRVVNKKYMGKQTVYPIQFGKRTVATATANHRWLNINGDEVTTENFINCKNNAAVKFVNYESPLGAVNEPHAYAIGALLGDGCSKEPGTDIAISSENDLIPNAVAEELGVYVRRNHPSNYTWELYHKINIGTIRKKVKCNHYDAWMNGLGAHEKRVDIDVIRTWNRDSLLRFVAGLIDTDGSIYSTKSNRLVINFCSQSQQIVEAFKYSILALWGIEATVKFDNRDKYVNGPCLYITLTNVEHIARILKELGDRIKTPRKRYKEEYSLLRSKLPKTMSVRYDRIREADTWDIEVDSDTHLFLLANGMVSHNSQLGGRIVAWKFMENHPYWNRDPSWGDEPLLIIVSGRLSDQVEELWEKKIKPYLPPNSYDTPKRSGGALKSVTNRLNGNKILFTSHDKANTAWEKIQSYVAHHMWIDEMPSHAKYIEEAHVRVDAKRGQCICTFTPKSKNEEIRNMVDNCDRTIGVKYQMGMLDNPLYFGREEEIIATTAHMSEERRNSKLYGSWITSDEVVFDFYYDYHVRSLPSDYSPSWAHVLAFDPAAGGYGGLVIAAQVPKTNIWHIVEAEYVKGRAPSDLVEAVRERAAKYNIVRKVYDVHEAWFHMEANKQNFSGWIAVDKYNRKKELITGLAQALEDRWLLFCPGMDKIYEEFRKAEWLDADEGKIRNSTKYHLLDALQYLIDNLPKIAEPRVVLTRDQEIIKAHLNTMIQEQEAKKAAKEMRRTGRRKFRINSRMPNRWIGRV